MISPMSSIEVVGPLRLFERCLESIQEIGALQVEEIPLADVSASQGQLHRIHFDPTQEQDRAALDDLNRILEEAVSHVPGDVVRRATGTRQLLEEYKRWEGESNEAVLSAARVLVSKVRSFVRRERNVSDDLRVLTEYEEIAAAFAPLVEGNELPRSMEFVGIILEKRNRLASALLKKEMDKLTGGQFRYVESSLSGGRTAGLLGFPTARSREVRFFLGKAGISEMRFPRYLRDRAFEQALATLEADLSALRKRRLAVREQAERFYVQNSVQVLAMHQLARDRLARREAVIKAVRTDFVFVVRGWVLRQRLEELSTRLARDVGPSVLVRKIKPGPMGRPPVLLQNPRPVRSFEPLLGLLPAPAYGSVDPTSFVATFFPPMFGLMLGDIGYGLLVGVLALLLFRGGRKRPALRQLGTVMAFCAAFAVIFGFVFGELFGDLGHKLGLKPLWKERLTLEGHDNTEAILGYLVIAVAIGLLHIVFGLVIGIFDARKRGDHNQVLGHLGRIAGIAILFIFVGRLADFLPPIFNSVGILGLLAFLVIMVYQTVHNPAHGLLLPLEVLGVIGNILSYARIMAIGMASVVLALLANMFAGMIGNIVLAVIVVLLVHALNLTLGIVDPTIQALRLHYVEFFSKFFIGGGKKFSPLSKLGGVQV
jgi:V/A-type H+-transporting ATPase subunit I